MRIQPHEWPARWRVWLSLLLVVGLVAGGLATAGTAHQQASLPVEVDVVEVSDPVKTDDYAHTSVWSAQVRITNTGPEPLELGVWVYSELQHAYAIWPVNGTTRLITVAPGETRTVTVRAPNYDASLRVPPDGVYGIWTVMTPDGQRRSHDIREVENATPS